MSDMPGTTLIAAAGQAGREADTVLSPHLVPASMHLSSTLGSPTELACRPPDTESFLKMELGTPTSKCGRVSKFWSRLHSPAPQSGLLLS